MHRLRRVNHALDILHTVALERVHELLLLHFRKTVVPRVAVEIPELLHVLVCDGLWVEGAGRGVGVCGLEEGGGGVVGRLSDVSREGMLGLILMWELGIEVVLVGLLLMVSLVLLYAWIGVGVLWPGVIWKEVG